MRPREVAATVKEDRGQGRAIQWRSQRGYRLVRPVTDANDVMTQSSDREGRRAEDVMAGIPTRRSTRSVSCIWTAVQSLRAPGSPTPEQGAFPTPFD